MGGEPAWPGAVLEGLLMAEADSAAPPSARLVTAALLVGASLWLHSLGESTSDQQRPSPPPLLTRWRSQTQCERHPPHWGGGGGGGRGGGGGGRVKMIILPCKVPTFRFGLLSPPTHLYPPPPALPPTPPPSH